ncbi:MAG: DNA helicase RecG, partial [Planctomycetota bacterium]
MFPDDHVQTVPGVGPGRARLLEKLGLRRVRDLLMFAPRRYQSYAEVQPISAATPGSSGSYVGDIVKVTRGRGSRRLCPVDV